MTREEAKEHLKEWRDVISSGHRKAVIDMAIEALSDKPTRKYKLNDETEIYLDEESYEIGYTHGQRADRPKGEWITNKDGYSKCSECGFSFGCIVCPHEETDFCPRCGAKMDKEGEE